MLVDADPVRLTQVVAHMDGYEIARRMRCSAAAKDALLVAVSGFPRTPMQPEDEAAFDHFLCKPVGLSALQELLRSASTRRGRKRPAA